MVLSQIEDGLPCWVHREMFNLVERARVTSQVAIIIIIIIIVNY